MSGFGRKLKRAGLSEKLVAAEERVRFLEAQVTKQNVMLANHHHSLQWTYGNVQLMRDHYIKYDGETAEEYLEKNDPTQLDPDTLRKIFSALYTWIWDVPATRLILAEETAVKAEDEFRKLGQAGASTEEIKVASAKMEEAKMKLAELRAELGIEDNETEEKEDGDEGQSDSADA